MKDYFKKIKGKGKKEEEKEKIAECRCDIIEIDCVVMSRKH